MSDVTDILNAIEQGDGQAAEELLPLVYDERIVSGAVSGSTRMRNPGLERQKTRSAPLKKENSNEQDAVCRAGECSVRQSDLR